jgi:hypothetical protein
MRTTLNSFIAMAAMLVLLVGCAPEQTSSARSEWIGKRRRDLIAALGEPTSATPLIQTGGELIIYAKSGHPHYAFETGPDGKVVKAAEMK